MHTSNSASAKKIMITGGAGFIGSHLAEAAASLYPGADIIVYDKMTYAAHPGYIEHLTHPRGNVRLVLGDIGDLARLKTVMDGVDLLIHAAAESHVDRSFSDPLLFSRTNVLGTHAVMHTALQLGVPRIVHVSTDEVYGSVEVGEVYEDERFDPTNPYSASKAGAEMVVNAYKHSFKLPVSIIRGNNAFGIRQFPEKLIPKAIMSLINKEPIPLHGDGSSIRHYLSARDFADAIFLVAEKGDIGEVYNVGSNEEYANREVAKMLCDLFGVDFHNAVAFTEDRLHNDRRYSVSWGKLERLGWEPRFSLRDDLPRIVEWYQENADSLRERLKVIRPGPKVLPFFAEADIDAYAGLDDSPLGALEELRTAARQVVSTAALHI